MRLPFLAALLSTALFPFAAQAQHADRRDREAHQWNRSMADWRDHYRAMDRFYDRLDRWSSADRDSRRRQGYFDPNWRDDDRYDWRDYRVRHRAIFRLPRYYPPVGSDHGYRRFSVGTRLASPLFGSGYWITDPSYYRLPPAGGSLRWVRYYDDALLVDVRNGAVIDAVHDIFR
jgi:hypothetical protein